MANIFLSTEERGIIVFWIWKSLTYSRRILISSACILGGFLLQLYINSVYPNLGNWKITLPGAILILAGNLLLLTRGYDNRVKFGKYSPSSGWEKIDKNKLLEIEKLINRMKKWDRNFFDSSNIIGCIPFVFLLIIIIGGIFFGWILRNNTAFIIFVDAGILIIPHWVTGSRSIMTIPNLLLKIRLVNKLLTSTESLLQNHQIEYFLYLKGDETKVPEDLKFRVKFINQKPDFLGYYGQIVTNAVGSKTYPYFYVVLVAKKGYGLKNTYDAYSPSSNITKEYKIENDVEVFVIRQTTTKTSGYHTKDSVMQELFLKGMEIAGDVAT